MELAPGKMAGTAHLNLFFNFVVVRSEIFVADRPIFPYPIQRSYFKVTGMETVKHTRKVNRSPAYAPA